ncbi:unnamed protein product [Phyllotreta striolata]|uniref:G-protein coupled receptors family 1 profile domain-containing protein n=1 Tax=Phyllotreta striolata TaxID=444603 RepID=A0A9N9TAY8_PHYSR|nr:unnamed protein product [Phyllotreta striolata]
MDQANVSESMELSESMIIEGFAVNDYVLIVLYIPVFIAALIANVTVIAIVLKNRYMRRINNYFLVNLSVADLLVTLVCMPNAVWRAHTSIYDFGRYTCKISAYIECVSVGSSIFTITTMAMYRYLAITRPLYHGIYTYRSLNRCSTTLIITCLWFMSLVAFSPILWVYDVNVVNRNLTENVTINMCGEDWTKGPIPQRSMGILWFIFVFAIPGIIIIGAYSKMGQTLCSDTPLFDDECTYSYQRIKLLRSRKKVACILLLLAVVFAICWLPKHITNLIDDTVDSEPSEENFDQNLRQSREEVQLALDYKLKQIKIKRYLLLLGHLNSALNPIIYCMLSKKFRNYISKMFCGTPVQKEVTKATLIKLNTFRRQPNNLKTSTQTNDASNGVKTLSPP